MVEKAACCGCSACADICGRNAISMKPDEFGFLYPEIDNKLCVHCGLCNKVCPVSVIEQVKSKTHFRVAYAGYISSYDELLKSASGGLFKVLADKALEQGTVLTGVRYKERFRKAEYYLISDKEWLEPARGSKYIQSEKGGIYREIERLLKKNCSVLFIGLPCEAAGLKAYLRKDYDKLTVGDLICYGCMAPVVADDYIDMLEHRYKSEVIFFTLKDKSYGWQNTSICAKFKNGKIYRKLFRNTEYGEAYNHLFRDSCYQCAFKGENRVSDFTIGDYWGVETDSPVYNKDGVSIVFVHTDKGKNMIESLDGLIYQPVDVKTARAWNKSIDICQGNIEDSYRFRKTFLNKGLIKATHNCKFILRNILPLSILDRIKEIYKKLGRKI
ncbi:MAG: Coenzyme F420 hydrogenase/dehydrogenase, beta subunit C-terminal domain [Clostridiales bacterium]|nr:Coenzyme F420 hydrogenase/dehydrogenase, beta subunit C-terminal domain [Clostridiales bacterium]